MADEVKRYERKCENWLRDFAKWTLPRSEAPETFIFWTGLFTLASTLKRRVFVGKKYLGSWACAPNLYILFIAPAGKARKSTTANYAEELFDAIPSNLITRAPELITKETLLTQITKSQDASMAILAPEFGEFIVKSGPTMFGFLTNMYDGKKKIDAATLSRGFEFAERPCINLLGATTPEWVAENMPESVIGGGFASRVVFIAEDKVRRRKMYYDDLDLQELDRMQKNLVDDLAHIAENIGGEFELHPDAKAFFDNWYNENADGAGSEAYKLSGYFERKPAHIHKVAMLLHVAYSDELVLYKHDFEMAIEIVEQTERRLPTVFQGIGRNPYTVDMYRLLDYIREKEKVSREDVKRHFMHAATPGMLNELIDGLAAANYISIKLEGMDAFLAPVKPALVVAQPNGKYSIDPTKVRAGTPPPEPPPAASVPSSPDQ